VPHGKRKRGREKEREKEKDGGWREVTAQWHGPVDAQCARETTKTTNPSSPVGERLKGLRGSALCVIVAPAFSGPVSTPVPSPMGYLSLSLFLPVSHRRRRRRYRPHGLVRRRDGSRVSTHRVYYQVLQTFKI